MKTIIRKKRKTAIAEGSSIDKQVDREIRESASQNADLMYDV